MFAVFTFIWTFRKENVELGRFDISQSCLNHSQTSKLTIDCCTINMIITTCYTTSSTNYIHLKATKNAISYTVAFAGPRNYRNTCMQIIDVDISVGKKTKICLGKARKCFRVIVLRLLFLGECRSLTGDIPELSPNLQNAMIVLKDRPVLLK